MKQGLKPPSSEEEENGGEHCRQEQGDEGSRKAARVLLPHCRHSAGCSTAGISGIWTRTPLIPQDGQRVPTLGPAHPSVPSVAEPRLWRGAGSGTALVAVLQQRRRRCLPLSAALTLGSPGRRGMEREEAPCKAQMRLKT